MKLFIVSIFVLVSSFSTYSQVLINTLETELVRLNTETALIINSQAIDEFPIWSLTVRSLKRGKE